MWRGLVLNRAVQQFLEDVHWGDLDFLLIDMPPGHRRHPDGPGPHDAADRGAGGHDPAGGRPEGGGPDGRHGPQGLSAGGRGHREHERLHLRARHVLRAVRLGRRRPPGRRRRRAPARAGAPAPVGGRRRRRRAAGRPGRRPAPGRRVRPDRRGTGGQPAGPGRPWTGAAPGCWNGSRRPWPPATRARPRPAFGPHASRAGLGQLGRDRVGRRPCRSSSACSYPSSPGRRTRSWSSSIRTMGRTVGHVGDLAGPGHDLVGRRCGPPASAGCRWSAAAVRSRRPRTGRGRRRAGPRWWRWSRRRRGGPPARGGRGHEEPGVVAAWGQLRRDPVAHVVDGVGRQDQALGPAHVEQARPALVDRQPVGLEPGPHDGVRGVEQGGPPSGVPRLGEQHPGLLEALAQGGDPERQAHPSRCPRRRWPRRRSARGTAPRRRHRGRRGRPSPPGRRRRRPRTRWPGCAAACTPRRPARPSGSTASRTSITVAASRRGTAMGVTLPPAPAAAARPAARGSGRAATAVRRDAVAGIPGRRRASTSALMASSPKPPGCGDEPGMGALHDDAVHAGGPPQVVEGRTGHQAVAVGPRDRHRDPPVRRSSRTSATRSARRMNSPVRIMPERDCGTGWG